MHHEEASVRGDEKQEGSGMWATVPGPAELNATVAPDNISQLTYTSWVSGAADNGAPGNYYRIDLD
eukprot:11198584-Lingulodinium_polyedra.AAC.1